MIRTSTTKIKRIYDTGQNPVLVSCNDDQEYVCKHSRGVKPSYVLFVEWLVYQLMSKLELELAPVSFVKIQEEHIDNSTICQPLFFNQTTCFATQFLEYAQEWDQLATSKSDLKRMINKDDLARIAFLDLWLSNEDRSWNNFNLLMNPTKEGLKVVPIDHGSCLNTLGFNIGRPLYQIEYRDSIISTEQYSTAMKSCFKSMKEVSDFVDLLYLRVKELESLYDEIINEIPINWQIPFEYIEELKLNLFHKNWLDETKTSFLSFTKTSLKLK